jgi:molybdopterin molybdotransferase
MISVDQARKIVIETFRSLPIELRVERVLLTAALGRVLAQEIVADTDQPPFDRSIKDGYAVRSGDIQKVPVVLNIVGESKAGDATLPRVSSGEAVRIMTGAALPDGADAVVMVEDTEAVESAAGQRPLGSFDSRHIRVMKGVREGANISRHGSEAHAGETLVPRGQRLRVHEISLAASTGLSAIEVFQKPRVSVLATGDELVPVDFTPAANQIRNSNSLSLGAMVERAGGNPLLRGIATDDPDDLKEKIGAALESSDGLLLTGGVSAGKYDFVEDALKALGVQTHFDAVAIRPGKPAVFGTRGHQFVFALPGNPVSAIVTFQLFVVPLLELLSGSAVEEPLILNARLESSFHQAAGRRGFLPAYYSVHNGDILVRTVRWKGSSDLAGLARSNCFLIAPENQEEFSAGSQVKILISE